MHIISYHEKSFIGMVIFGGIYDLKIHIVLYSCSTLEFRLDIQNKKIIIDFIAL